MTPTPQGQSAGPWAQGNVTPPSATSSTPAALGQPLAGVRAAAAVQPLPDMHTNPVYGSTPVLSLCGNEPTPGLSTAATAAAATTAGASTAPAAPPQPPAPLLALSTGAVGRGLTGGWAGEAGHAAAVPHNAVATALSSPAGFVHANGAGSRTGGRGGYAAPAVSVPEVPGAAAAPAGARADAATGQHGTGQHGSTANASAAASTLPLLSLQPYTPAAPLHRPVAQLQQQQPPLPAPAVDVAIMSAAIQEARLVAERLRLQVQQKGAPGTGVLQQQQQNPSLQPQPPQLPPQDLSPFPVLLRECSQGSSETPAETLAAVAAAARSPLRHSSLSRGSTAAFETAAGVKAACGSVDGSPGMCVASAEAAPASVSKGQEVGRGSRAPAGLQAGPEGDSQSPGAAARRVTQQKEQQQQQQQGLTRPQQLSAAIEALQALQAQLQARQEAAAAPGGGAGSGGGGGGGGGGGLAAAEELRRQLLQERQRLEALLRGAA